MEQNANQKKSGSSSPKNEGGKEKNEEQKESLEFPLLKKMYDETVEQFIELLERVDPALKSKVLNIPIVLDKPKVSNTPKVLNKPKVLNTPKMVNTPRYPSIPSSSSKQYDDSDNDLPEATDYETFSEKFPESSDEETEEEVDQLSTTSTIQREDSPQTTKFMPMVAPLLVDFAAKTLVPHVANVVTNVFEEYAERKLSDGNKEMLAKYYPIFRRNTDPTEPSENRQPTQSNLQPQTPGVPLGYLQGSATPHSHLGPLSETRIGQHPFVHPQVTFQPQVLPINTPPRPYTYQKYPTETVSGQEVSTGPQLPPGQGHSASHDYPQSNHQPPWLTPPYTQPRPQYPPPPVVGGIVTHFGQTHASSVDTAPLPSYPQGPYQPQPSTGPGVSNYHRQGFDKQQIPQEQRVPPGYPSGPNQSQHIRAQIPPELEKYQGPHRPQAPLGQEIPVGYVQGFYQPQTPYPQPGSQYPENSILRRPVSPASTDPKVTRVGGNAVADTTSVSVPFGQIQPSSQSPRPGPYPTSLTPSSSSFSPSPSRDLSPSSTRATPGITQVRTGPPFTLSPSPTRATPGITQARTRPPVSLSLSPTRPTPDITQARTRPPFSLSLSPTRPTPGITQVRAIPQFSLSPSPTRATPGITQARTGSPFSVDPRTRYDTSPTLSPEGKNVSRLNETKKLNKLRGEVLQSLEAIDDHVNFILYKLKSK